VNIIGCSLYITQAESVIIVCHWLLLLHVNEFDPIKVAQVNNAICHRGAYVGCSCPFLKSL